MGKSINWVKNRKTSNLKSSNFRKTFTLETSNFRKTFNPINVEQYAKRKALIPQSLTILNLVFEFFIESVLFFLE